MRELTDGTVNQPPVSSQMPHQSGADSSISSSGPAGWASTIPCSAWVDRVQAPRFRDRSGVCIRVRLRSCSVQLAAKVFRDSTHRLLPSSSCVRSRNEAISFSRAADVPCAKLGFSAPWFPPATAVFLAFFLFLPSPSSVAT